jgi:hypothetical protein
MVASVRRRSPHSVPAMIMQVRRRQPAIARQRAGSCHAGVHDLCVLVPLTASSPYPSVPWQAHVHAMNREYNDALAEYFQVRALCLLEEVFDKLRDPFSLLACHAVALAAHMVASPDCSALAMGWGGCCLVSSCGCCRLLMLTTLRPLKGGSLLPCWLVPVS